MISTKCANLVLVEDAIGAGGAAMRLLRTLWNTVLDGFAVYGACMDGHVADDLRLSRRSGLSELPKLW